MNFFSLVSLALIGLAAANSLPEPADPFVGSARAYVPPSGVYETCDLSAIKSLPEYLKPSAYALFIHPDIGAMSVAGTVRISVLTTPNESVMSHIRKSNHLYLHADQSIKIKKLEAYLALQDNHIVSVCRDPKNQLLDIKFKERLDSALIIGLAVKFESKIRRDGKGVHVAEENGTEYIKANLQNGGIRYAFPSFDDPKFNQTSVDLTLYTNPNLAAAASTNVETELDSIIDRKSVKSYHFVMTQRVTLNELDFVVGDASVVADVQGSLTKLPEYHPVYQVKFA